MVTQPHDIQDKIRGANLKCTKARELVLRALTKSKKPAAIDELYKDLKGEVHMVTLYRILRDFVNAGLVYQTDFRTGKAYFEYQEVHHHHVSCTSCNKRSRVRACISVPEVQADGFSSIQNHALEFFGVCRDCEKQLQKK